MYTTLTTKQNAQLRILGSFSDRYFGAIDFNYAIYQSPKNHQFYIVMFHLNDRLENVTYEDAPTIARALHVELHTYMTAIFDYKGISFDPKDCYFFKREHAQKFIDDFITPREMMKRLSQ